MLRKVQDQESRDDRVVYADQPDGEPRQHDRPGSQLRFTAVRVRFPGFRDPCEKRESGQRAHGLCQCGMLERSHPMADHGTGGHSTPDPAADVPERLAAAMHSRQFDRPCGRACVEAGLSEALENAREIDAGKSERREINGARDRAAQQAGGEGDLAPAPVREGPGENSRGKRGEGENADGKPDRFVRCRRDRDARAARVPGGRCRCRRTPGTSPPPRTRTAAKIPEATTPLLLL